MERATAGITAVDSKLNTLVKRSNACCLWTIIVLEIIVIVLIILWII